MTEIRGGLKEGDEVLLYAPVGQETRAGLKESPLEKARSGKKGPGSYARSNVAIRSGVSGTSVT